MSKINILQLITVSSIGGSETIALDQIKSSRNPHLRYALCSLQAPGKIHEYARAAGIPAYSLGFNGFLDLFAARRRLKHLIHEREIDVVHVYGLRADLLCRWIGLRSLVIVTAVHSVYIKRGRVNFWLDHFTHNAVALYISNSYLGADFYAQEAHIPREKFAVIHSGVDPERFRKDHGPNNFRERWRLPPETLVITLLAEINSSKGHFVAAQAVKLLKARCTYSFRLICIGRDATAGCFATTVTELGLDEEILVLGFCESEMVHYVLNAADLQILPSYTEGLPTALIEAMAFELPVVSTLVGGIPELVEDGVTGFLVPAGEPESLAKRIQDLMENPVLRVNMGAAGRKRVEEKFSIHAMTAAIEAQYQALITIRKCEPGLPKSGDNILMKNVDPIVIQGFGEEWSRFDQTRLPERDLENIFDSYFAIFPWGKLPRESIGIDVGCGSGRWASLVAPRVGTLHCVDASQAALNVARRNLRQYNNCRFHLASVDCIPLPDESADFVYALGVLHHIPDTGAGIRACVSRLKRGGVFLLYLYFAFDNKPKWYKALWATSEVGRFIISRLPFRARYVISQFVALSVYWPLAKFALLVELLGISTDSWPLAYYRKLSLYVMRTDALDRLGTRLEKRFAKSEILELMEDAGLKNVVFSSSKPYWCAVGYKK